VSEERKILYPTHPHDPEKDRLYLLLAKAYVIIREVAHPDDVKELEAALQAVVIGELGSATAEEIVYAFENPVMAWS
jgi:hypothetical protein